MPKTVPDPEVDFDGCLQAMVDNAVEEVEGLSDTERWSLYFDKSVGRVMYMREVLKLEADDLILQLAYQRLEKLLVQRRTGTYPEGALAGFPEWFP